METKQIRAGGFEKREAPSPEKPKLPRKKKPTPPPVPKTDSATLDK